MTGGDSDSDSDSDCDERLAVAPTKVIDTARASITVGATTPTERRLSSPIATWDGRPLSPSRILQEPPVMLSANILAGRMGRGGRR
jgi:hypothetical protein